MLCVASGWRLRGAAPAAVARKNWRSVAVSSRDECEEVHNQCDYLHGCNNFITNATSVRFK
jgi:hypothetical protein